MRKEKEYVELNKETMEIVAYSLRNRGFHLVSGVIPRLVSDKIHPSLVHINRLEELDMLELFAKKKRKMNFLLPKSTNKRWTSMMKRLRTSFLITYICRSNKSREESPERFIKSS